MQNVSDSNFFFNRYVTVQRNFNHIELNQSPSNQVDLNGEISSSGSLLLVPLSFVALSGLLLFLLQANLWKNFRNNLMPIKHLRKIPCANCQFFNSNPFLKCAVHPSKVLSPEARDCSDFSPQDKKPSSDSSDEF